MAYDNREPGIVGAHVGPNTGETPANYADLHAGENPYGNGLGSPSADLNWQLVYGQGKPSDNLREDDLVGQTPWQVGAPYFANPPAAGGNPHSQSAPTKSEAGDLSTTAAMAGGI